ncbi:MAG: hypothetical protein ABSD90_10635 [Methylocystis sp.]|jgi:hypothetical protein
MWWTLFDFVSPSLEVGESNFQPLEKRDGIVVTLGRNAHFFDRPGRSVCRWTGTRHVPRQSPHPLRRRSWFRNEVATFLRILCGGGDVKINMIATLDKQREILLTAGDGNVVEKIDLSELAREGAPPLQFLQPAYLCSCSRASFRSVFCDAFAMSWARAPFAYRTYALKDVFKPAILCLSGRTNVWRERLEPGESRDFALGNVIAVTVNIVSKLRPSNQYYPDDFKIAIAEDSGEEKDEAASAAPNGMDAKRMLRELRASLKTLFESIRAREGFFVCELSNPSRKPAFVYVQLNKSELYGGSGLVGVAVKALAILFRSSHFMTG